MQNTYINQNQDPNNMNQINLQVQGQYQPNQPNQPYIQPQGLIPPPYLSSQNLNTPCNITNPQAFSQGQPNQNPYLDSLMKYYRPAEGIPLNSISPLNARMAGYNALNIYNNAFNGNNNNNINIDNIKNVAQIPHYNFTQPDDNTFLISTKSIIIAPIILICSSIPFFVVPIVCQIPAMFVMYIFALVPVIISICICAHNVLSVYFILGPNNITVKVNKFFRRQTRIYNTGELLRVEYKEKIKYLQNSHRFEYDIVFVPVKGEPEPVYHIGRGVSFTLEELGYFLHVVNKHIQTKMNPK